jgi:hypothetical protein
MERRRESIIASQLWRRFGIRHVRRESVKKYAVVQLEEKRRLLEGKQGRKGKVNPIMDRAI